ncbi:Septum-associated rare lipoprotein A, partial [hydrothermal vent metagenome]
ASWYGPNFQGRLTANGETFDQYFLSAAHPTLPLPSYVQVKNLSNGRTVTVRVNDRGPFASNRIIDLSRRAAEVLGFINQGTARVKVTYLGRAPVNGDDTNYLVASIGKNNTGAGGLPIPQPDYGQQNSRQPSIISRQNGGIFGAVISLFSYAEQGQVEPGQGAKMISDAHQAAAAANSLANASPELLAWANGVENNSQNPMPADQSTPVSIDLGTFENRQFAAEVARQFALFGAVDATYSSTGSNSPIRLVMTRLKAGVGEADVVQFIAELGLNTS